MRYAVLEYSTDLRYPNYSVLWTSSQKTAKKLVEDHEAKLTHGDMANEIRNYHHNLRCAYVLNDDFKKPTQSQLEKMLREKRTGSVYDPKSTYDILANLIKRNGTPLKW